MNFSSLDVSIWPASTFGIGRLQFGCLAGLEFRISYRPSTNRYLPALPQYRATYPSAPEKTARVSIISPQSPHKYVTAIYFPNPTTTLRPYTAWDSDSISRVLSLCQQSSLVQSTRAYILSYIVIFFLVLAQHLLLSLHPPRR
jgi:hypothetical protein